MRVSVQQILSFNFFSSMFLTLQFPLHVFRSDSITSYNDLCCSCYFFSTVCILFIVLVASAHVVNVGLHGILKATSVLLATKCINMKCRYQKTNGTPEQFVPFCCAINMCQMRTNDKLEKCVHSVVLLCSMYRNLYRMKSIHGRH